MVEARQHHVGSIFDGKFLLEEVLGRGGMGTVYRATHLKLDGSVAIKVLHEEFSEDEGARRRFEREARVLSRLSHPSAVQVHDFGVHNGLLYLVMEYIAGQRLREVLQLKSPGGLNWDRIWPVARAMAEVLKAAHSLELVHRDLKPENILIERLASGGERVVVVDFGLAFVVEDSELGRMTATGVVAGTPLYVSPEQADGQRLSPATDIYSFGCILYEMGSGRPPFIGKSTVKLLNSHLFVPPVPLSSMSPQLEAPEAFGALVMSMLAKTPEVRPTATEVLENLREMTQGEVEGGDSLLGEPWPEEFLEAKTELLAKTEVQIDRGQSPQTDSLPVHRSMRVAFVGHPVSANLIARFTDASLSCHLYTAEHEYEVIFAPEANPELVAQLAQVAAVVTSSEVGDLKRRAELTAAGASAVVARPLPHSAELARVVRHAALASRRNKSS